MTTSTQPQPHTADRPKNSTTSVDANRHLIAWCELRQDFRSFRTDRVTAAGFLGERYPERPSVLRTKWRRSLVSRAKAT